MKQTEKFWESLDDRLFFEKYIVSPQIQEWADIISNWNYSSVKLKNYLKRYYPSEFGQYDSVGDINVNHILPYRHNSFWGTNDLWRLEYAIKCKIVILGQYGLDEIRMQYVIECLRLWLRFNSKTTLLSWPEFRTLVDRCYIETEQDWYGTVKLCQDVCIKYKHKRKQTMYHYKEADFCLIQDSMTLSEAYDFWLMYEFPNILDRYKAERLKEFKAMELKSCNKVDIVKYEAFKKDLDIIKIKKPSYRAFGALLKRNNIVYKH